MAAVPAAVVAESGEANPKSAAAIADLEALLADRATGTAPAGDAEAPCGPTTNYLIWEELAPKANKLPSYRTAWIEDGVDGPQLKGTSDSLLLAFGEDVFIWDVVAQPMQIENCEWSPGDDEAHRLYTIEDRSSRLIRAGRFVAPIDVYTPVTGGTWATEEFVRTQQLMGNAGPYVFTKEITYELECESANGETRAQAKIIDLRSGSVVDLARPLDAQAYSTIGPQLIAALESKDPDGNFTRPSDHTGVLVATLRPKIVGDRIQIQQQLAVETAGFASDGEWYDDTLSVYLPVETAAVSGADLKVPDPVRAHLNKASADRPRGFTKVTTDAALSAARQVFASP